MPIIWKVLSFTKKYKNKISNRLKIYLNENELFKTNLLDINYIEEYYAQIIENKNTELRKILLIIKKVEENKVKYKKNMSELEKYEIPKEEKIITNKKAKR